MQSTKAYMQPFLSYEFFNSHISQHKHVLNHSSIQKLTTITSLFKNLPLPHYSNCKHNKKQKNTQEYKPHKTHIDTIFSQGMSFYCPGLAQTLHRRLLVPGRDGSGTCRAAEEVGMLSGMSLLLSLDFVLADGASLLEPLGLA